MKRMYIFFLCIVSLSLLAACGNDKPLESTDLSNITLDGIQLGHNFEEVSTDEYTQSDRFPEKNNTINFEEWKITVDENSIITKIHANMSDIEISVNSNINCKTKEDVINTLGKNYSSGWYDREQKLKQLIYIDNDNHIQAIFIYDNHGDQLVWVIFERTD